MRLSRKLRAALFLAVAAIFVIGQASTASAHRNDESYLYLDVGDASLSGRVEMPYRDMRSVFGLEISGTADELIAEFEANLDLLQTYADDNTTIGADGAEWPIEFDGVELLFDTDSGPNGLGYVVLPFTVGGDDQSKDLFGLYDSSIDKLLGVIK